MDETRLSWLLECADRLRHGADDIVDMPRLLTQLNIEYRTLVGRDGQGELRVDSDGTYRVVIKTADGKLLWDRKERFTAAHELAHALLLRKWNYRPQRSNHREYFACERMCNRFAGRLLVSPAAIEQIDCSTPEACLFGVRELATKCSVSLEAAAKELVMTRPGIAICFVLTGRKVIVWGVSSISNFKETRNRLFAVPSKSASSEQECGSEASRACARWLSKSLQTASMCDDLKVATVTLGRESELVSLNQ